MPRPPASASTASSSVRPQSPAPRSGRAVTLNRSPSTALRLLHVSVHFAIGLRKPQQLMLASHAAMDRLGNAAGKVDDDLCFHQGTVAGQNAIQLTPASSKYPAPTHARPIGPACPSLRSRRSDGQRVAAGPAATGRAERQHGGDRVTGLVIGDGRNKLRRGCPPVHFAWSIVSRLQVADEVSVLMRSCSSAGFRSLPLSHPALGRYPAACHRPCGLVLMLPVCRPIWS